MLKASLVLLSLVSSVSFSVANATIAPIPALKCTGIWVGTAAKMPAELTLGSTTDKDIAITVKLDGRIELSGTASFSPVKYKFHLGNVNGLAVFGIDGTLDLNFQSSRKHAYGLEMKAGNDLRGFFVCDKQ